MFGPDPMGRIDLAGKPVPFYPSARSLNHKQQSATKDVSAPKPRENPQKDLHR
jgi:hypothetical protein